LILQKRQSKEQETTVEQAQPAPQRRPASSSFNGESFGRRIRPGKQQQQQQQPQTPSTEELERKTESSGTEGKHFVFCNLITT